MKESTVFALGRGILENEVFLAVPGIRFAEECEEPEEGAEFCL